jgi:hypothetical protein
MRKEAGAHKAGRLRRLKAPQFEVALTFKS